MNKKSAGILLVSATTLIGLASCGPSSNNNNLHTYNTYLSTSPTNWNVHNWQTADESYVQSFTEIGFYDTVLNDARDGYDFVTEMASAFPEMVAPGDLSDEEVNAFYSEAGNADEKMVWDIKLNKDAVWEDGTPIKAADYVKSMELQLDPDYANYRADSYYNGNLVIANAEKIYKSGRQTIEAAYGHLNNKGNVPNDSGIYYINLGRDTAYVSNIFGEDASSSSFYTLLNQRASKGSDAMELAAKRITNGFANMLMIKFKQGKLKFTSEDKPEDWEKVSKPSDVKSDWMNYNIDLTEFDTEEVMTVKTNSDDWSESNRTRYTMAALKKDLSTFVAAMNRGEGSTASYNWKLPLFTLITNDDFEGQMGLKAIDDYTLRLYLAKQISSLDLRFALSSNWLVKTDLYEKLTSQSAGGGLQTKYASNAVENYMSYGPYKLTYFEAGKEIKMEKNEKWYGYKDGKHTFTVHNSNSKFNGKTIDEFQMDVIDTKIIQTHETAVAEFEAGRLDDIDLNVNDMKKYGQSGRRSTTYESYTQKISLNSDFEKLASRQSGSINKTILANADFRKGLSLAINRNEFAAQATAGSKASTNLLNDLYLANNATGESYRSTKQGKTVYGSVYNHLGGSSIDEESGAALAEDKNGFNATLAAQYLAKGLKTELESTRAGSISKGQSIELDFPVYDEKSANTIAADTLINASWTAAITKANAILVSEGVLGAGDPGFSIKTKMIQDQDYYTSAKNGAYEMIFSIWGGAAINPYGLMEVYAKTTFESTCEYGFKGHQGSTYLTFDYDEDGTEEKKSFNDWYEMMANTLVEGDYEDAVKAGGAKLAEWSKIHEQKLNILSHVEAGILNRFEAIPLVARGTSSLRSFKIENATDTYVSLIGYGGIRKMTFEYDDGAWSDLVKSYNGNLSTAYAGAGAED